MKKAILILIVIIVIALVGVFTYAALNANSLVTKFKPDIEKVATEALGTPVHLGAIEASVFPETKLRIAEFRIGGDSATDSLALHDLQLHIKLIPLLTGALDIQKLSLVNPHLVLEKNAQGIAIAGLPQKGTSRVTTEQASAAQKTVASSQEVPSALKLNLEEFSLKNATITFNDHIAKKSYTVRELNIDSALSFKENVATLSKLAVSASLPGSAPLSIKGEDIRFGLKDGIAKVPSLVISLLGNVINVSASYATKEKKGDLSLSSDAIALDSFTPLLNEFAPELVALQPVGTLVPKISAAISPTVMSAKGSIRLQGIGAQSHGYTLQQGQGTILINVSNTSKSVQSDDLSFVVNDKPLTLTFDGGLEGVSDAIIRSLTLKGFGGSVQVKAKTALDATKRFTASSLVEGINLSEALSVAKPELGALVSGTLTHIQADISGELGPDLMKSLLGSAEVRLNDCTIQGYNLVGEVLDTINSLPFYSGSLKEAAREEEGGEESSTTAISSLTGNFRISGGGLTTNNLLVVSPQFDLSARGAVSFDSTLDLATSLALEERKSQRLAGRIRELSYALDERNRLVIPVLIRGKVPSVKVLPDVQQIIERAAKRGLADKANKALDKLLGGRGEKSGKGGLGGILGF